MKANREISGSGPDLEGPNLQQDPGAPPKNHEIAYGRELERRNAELLETQEALEATRDRYMDLFDSAPVGFVTLGRHGIIREANLTAVEMLGRNRRGLLERPLAGFLGPGQSQELFAHLRRAWDTRGHTTTELLLRAPSGATFPVRIDTVLSHSAGDAPAYLVTLTDISDQKRLEAENQRRNRELEQLARTGLVGEVASTLSHDLNQPLAAISNYATAARYDLADPDSTHERAREILEKMTEQVDYAGDLIRTVREMLRPSEEVEEALDLNRITEESLSLVAKYAEEHRVRLRANLAGDLSPVTGSSTQLKQVVVNLAINAVEAYDLGKGPASPEITIRTRKGEAGEALLEVIDTAGGMDEETHRHLFDPFYSTKSEGTGMGLAISHTIIENHGGALWAQANLPSGTTFSFRLPAG